MFFEVPLLCVGKIMYSKAASNNYTHKNKKQKNSGAGPYMEKKKLLVFWQGFFFNVFL